METGLPLLGQPVRAGEGLRGVALVPEESRFAVLHARAQMGPVLLQQIAPYGHVVGRSALPADVLFPDDQIGDEVDGSVLVAAGDRRARGVHRVGRLVQPAQVGGDVVASHPELGEDAPHDHRGVVDVLGDDFAQLLQPEGRGCEVGHVAQEG